MARLLDRAREHIVSAKLEYLAYYFGFHFTGHRAVNDCQALLEVLQCPLPMSGVKAMQALLQNAADLRAASGRPAAAIGLETLGE